MGCVGFKVKLLDLNGLEAVEVVGLRLGFSDKMEIFAYFSVRSGLFNKGNESIDITGNFLGWICFRSAG